MNPGDKVMYTPTRRIGYTPQKGVVKAIHPEEIEAVWVVFNCGEDWDNYQNYTGQLTRITDLSMGWPEEQATL